MLDEWDALELFPTEFNTWGHVDLLVDIKVSFLVVQLERVMHLVVLGALLCLAQSHLQGRVEIGDVPDLLVGQVVVRDAGHAFDTNVSSSASQEILRIDDGSLLYIRQRELSALVN